MSAMSPISGTANDGIVEACRLRRRPPACRRGVAGWVDARGTSIGGLLVMLLMAVATAADADAQVIDSLTGATSSVQTQSLDATGSATVPSVAPATQSPAQAGTISTRPRSTRVYWHVFLSFGLAWLLLFAYVASLGRRFGHLEAEVRALVGESDGRSG